MDGFQGAVLGVKLPHLDRWNALRRNRADRYRERLSGTEEVRLPQEADGARHVYHLFTIRAARRDDLAGALRDAGIATGVAYPFPLHLTPAYSFLGYGIGDFPVCEEACEEILSLPMYPELSDRQVDSVCDRIRSFYARAAATAA